MSTTSIDDVLLTAHLPPEKRLSAIPPTSDSTEGDFETENLSGDNESSEDLENKPQFQPKSSENEPKSENKPELESETHDEYGNEKPKSTRTYTEDEVNERINKAVRERFERFERNNPVQHQPNQPTQQQQQQAKDAGFNYDQNSQQTWDQQLKAFIRQTNEEIQREVVQRDQNEREIKILQEFETRLKTGMGRFNDFVEVVSPHNISDAMTMATRGMKDPAAFLYAASKRQPEELARISKISDPYVQMAEMGRLEERMKKNASTTKTPRPVSLHREDVVTSEPKKKAITIEDMIRESESRKLAKMARRR